MKRYPACKDSGIEWIGKVPENWKVNRLKTVCTFTYGNSLANEDRIEGDISVYGSNGIVGYHNKAITNKPCIIIGRKGSYGKVNFSQTECFPIDTTYFVDDHSAKCDLKWLNYVLPLLELDKFSKDTGVPGLNREEAHDKRIPIPKDTLQKIIVGFLDRKTAQIDDLIAKKERMIELLKEERTAVINQTVTKGLDPNVEMKDSGIDGSTSLTTDWLGKVPKHWETLPVKYHYDVQLGKMLQNIALSPSDQLVPYLKALHVLWGKVTVDDLPEMWSDTGELSQYGVEDGDLLVCEGGEVGRAGIVHNPPKNCIIQNALHRIRANGRESLVTYLLYIMYAVSSVGWFSILCNKATIAHFTREKFVDLKIPIPPRCEQEKIVDFLNLKTAQIDAQVTRDQKSIGYLKEYRAALISEVVTGKIDVRNQ